MADRPPLIHRRRPTDDDYAFRFTPAEWRRLISDSGFLRDGDNSYLAPRRLMGVRVEIVPDHRFG